MTFYSDKEIRDIIFNSYNRPKYANEKINITSLTIKEHSNVCVDDLLINFHWKNNVLVNVEYKAIGCAVFISSCDLMCELILNKTKEKIKSLNDLYFDLINSSNATQKHESLKKMLVFKKIKTHLNRLECGSIIYRAIKKEIYE